jgi:hypothetical protein
MHGQAFVAQTEFGRQLQPGESVKVVCAPTHRLAERLNGRTG